MGCAVCGRKVRNHKSGLCNRHYHRLLKYGDARGGPRPKGNVERADCSVCGKPARCSGLCKTHYDQRVRGETPHLVKDRYPRGEGHVTTNGYRKVPAEGHPNADKTGGILEHRLLMSRALGRPLSENETAHHRDGQRTNNSIGPCYAKRECDCPGNPRHNLELWSTKQPKGQRVADKVACAREILALYGRLKTE